MLHASRRDRAYDAPAGTKTLAEQGGGIVVAGIHGSLEGHGTDMEGTSLQPVHKRLVASSLMSHSSLYLVFALSLFSLSHLKCLSLFSLFSMTTAMCDVCVMCLCVVCCC